MNDLLHFSLRKPLECTTYRRVAIMLIALHALAWISLALGSEIHDAAGHGDVEEIRALLKSNPDLLNSKDEKWRDTSAHRGGLERPGRGEPVAGQ